MGINENIFSSHRFVNSLLLIITVILFFVHSSAYAGMVKTNEEHNEIQNIIKRGKLVVGLYYKDMPPFFMTDSQGRLQGLDVELARKITDYLNVDVEFNREAQSYQQLYEMIARGEVDVVISKFSKTFKRARVIRYTDPYVTFRRALVVNSTFATKKKIKDYPMTYLRTAEVKIGVKANTSYVEFARELFPNAKIVELKNWKEVISELKQGKIKAALYDENEVIRSIHRNSDIAIFASVYILKDQKDYIAMAVPRQSTQLLSWLNFFLKNFGVDYTVNDLMEMYPDIYK